MAGQKPKVVYWKPGGVVRGQQVYLDANFLVGLSAPGHIWHSSARGLLAALQSRDMGLVLSSLALNEAIYQLMRLDEAVGPVRWPDQISEAVLKLPNLKNFEPPDQTFHRQTMRGVAELGLDPTDAFHYAAARYLNCPLVSNDAGFLKIPDQSLTVVTFYGPEH